MSDYRPDVTAWIQDCRYCGRELGRQVAAGSHYDCRLEIQHALSNLAACLAAAGQLCEAWKLTFNNMIAWQHGTKVLWRPGCNIAEARSECQYCGKSIPFDCNTCAGCADERGP